MSPYKGLEAFKFGVYVAIPICLTAFVVFRPDNLKAIIDNRGYVQYPEGEAHTFEELQEGVRRKREERKSG